MSEDFSGRVIISSQRLLPDNTHNIPSRQTSVPLGFEPRISAGERPQTFALDRAAVLVLNVPFIASANASGKIFHSAKYLSNYVRHARRRAGRSVGKVSVTVVRI